MAKARPATVEAYLASLPEDRRTAISAVRVAVRRSLPKGYEEGLQYGMIGWYVPHSIYPAGYHCDPKQGLPFAGLASQKRHMSLYLMAVYGDADLRRRFEAAWKKTGKRLDMGQACVRFRKVDDLALDVIEDTISSIPVEAYVRRYEAARKATPRRKKA